MPGKGRMQITGKLGDVMQESVKAAKSFVRSKCLEYGIIPPLFEKKDFHIHVPEGATPKDCLLYTSPSPRDLSTSRMPSSA